MQGTPSALDWSDSACVEHFQLIVREDSPKGPKALDWQLNEAQAITGKLDKGTSYYWRVTAVNAVGKSNSVRFLFKVK